MPQGSHTPGREQLCTHAQPPLWETAGPTLSQRTDRGRGRTSPALLFRVHLGHSPVPTDLPAGTVGKVKGDDDHHTCVITSAIGLAYQTFTGPSISSFKPFPTQKYTASWFLFSCSEIQCVSQDLPTSCHPERKAGPCKRGFLLYDTSLHERASLRWSVSDCQDKGNCKLESSLATRST